MDGSDFLGELSGSNDLVLLVLPFVSWVKRLCEKASNIPRSCIRSFGGAGRSSEVERSLMVRWVVGSILHRVDPLSYFSLTASAPRLVYQRLWDGAYKRTLAVNR